MRRQRGLTAIELATVVTVLAVLSALAAPSLTNLIRSNQVSSVVNTFMADMRFARSEAIRRGGAVVMCRSDAPEAASPTCGTASNDWVSGWIIFEDRDKNGAFGNGDQLLKVQARITTVDSLPEGSGSTSTNFQFAPTGRLVGSSSPIRLTVGSTAYGSQKRNVCVGLSGRVRVLAQDEPANNCQAGQSGSDS